LPVNVADDRDRCLYVHDIALFHKQFLRLSAHRFDDRVGQELLAVEAFDAFVQIYAGYTRLSVEGPAPRAIGGHVPGRPGIAQEWRGGELVPQIKTSFGRPNGAFGTTQIAQPGLIILSSR
jgi:hypothetical protein